MIPQKFGLNDNTCFVMSITDSDFCVVSLSIKSLKVSFQVKYQPNGNFEIS